MRAAFLNFAAASPFGAHVAMMTADGVVHRENPAVFGQHAAGIA
jgi:hypothetical protein